MSYSLVCTTRFDPSLQDFKWNNAPDGSPSPYLLLAYQLDRLRSSAWAVSEVLDYTRLKDVCDKAVQEVNGVDGKTPLKIRVVLAPSGSMTASATPLDRLRYDLTAPSQFNPEVDDHSQFHPILSIELDTKPTSGTGPLKTTHRKPYDDARARAGIPPLGAPNPRDIVADHPDDVILFNTSKIVMESTICNVAFFRGGKWLTPPLSVGCVSGVFRRWLLENDRIHEVDEHSLPLDIIRDHEWVLVFNGVSGCRLGRVRSVNRNPIM